MGRLALRLFAAAGLLFLAAPALAPPARASGGSMPDPVPCPGCWHPGPATTWQYQLTGAVDTSVDADAFSVDLFDVPRSVVSEIHASGRHVACYVNAGAWEDWRPDAGRYPAAILGRPLDGWPGERWLDVRRLDLLRPILRDRLARCAAKGFDAVDFDNVDGYTNDSGFPLSGWDQRRFNVWLANSAHRRGLAAGLKNDLAQVTGLAPYFDFAVNEQCFFYHECRHLWPFAEAGKSVMVVEYDLPRSAFCAQAAESGYFAMRKRLSLGVWRRPCA